MNRNDFIDLLEEKVQVTRHTLGEVYELIDLFPYFQSAHLMLLKGLKNTGDVKFEKQLRISSVHIADREILYYQLQRQPEAAIVREPLTKEKAATEPEGYDHQQTVIESAKNSEQLIDEIEKDSGVAQNDQASLALQHHSHSILVSMEDEAEASDEVMTVLDEETTVDEEKIFYMDPGFAVPGNEELLELDAEAEKEPDHVETKMAKSVEAPDSEVVSGKGNGKILSQSELIDRFIMANPRIEPVRDPAKVSTVDISKPFTEFEGGLVTETLARIYVNQGYYSRAIEIYEKLSLKYPEKSSYFASQIELVQVHLKK